MTKTTQLIVAALALVAVWWFFIRKSAERGDSPRYTFPVNKYPPSEAAPREPLPTAISDLGAPREPLPTAISDLGAPATGGIASIPVSSRFINLG